MKKILLLISFIIIAIVLLYNYKKPEYYGTNTLGLENCHIIWLPSLKERKPLIKQLEADIQQPITIFEAINGKTHVSDYLEFKNVDATGSIKPGAIGCLLSHVELLESTSQDSIVVFEDDCVFNSTLAELHSFIDDAPQFDILCMGTNITVESTPVDSSYVRVQKFYGTHALILNRKAIDAVLATHEKYTIRKKFLPADWLYSIAIQEYGLRAFAPTDNEKYFTYKHGLISSITEVVR